MAVYAVSDIHGNGSLWNAIKDFLKPEDTLYILGDCGDRGPDGWSIICDALEMDNVIYLMGNHEQMLYNALMEQLKPEEERDLLERRRLFYNGGKKTYNDAYKNGFHNKLNKLGLLPYWEVYINSQGVRIILTHAGFTPTADKNYFPPYEDLIWNRDHFWDEWDEENNSNVVCVHGHSPVPYLASELIMKVEEPRALWYCNNHKVCIDMGTYNTNITVLLDLDTFEEHIFTKEQTANKHWIS